MIWKRSLGTIKNLRGPVGGRGGGVIKRLHKITMGGGTPKDYIRLQEKGEYVEQKYRSKENPDFY